MKIKRQKFVKNSIKAQVFAGCIAPIFKSTMDASLEDGLKYATQDDQDVFNQIHENFLEEKILDIEDASELTDQE